MRIVIKRYFANIRIRVFFIGTKRDGESLIEITIRGFIERIKDIFRIPIIISHINSRNRDKYVKK